MLAARSSSVDNASELLYETPQLDAFAELVKLAVEKDPSLAGLAEQHLKGRGPAAGASAMLGPSLPSLPNSSKPSWLRQRAPQGDKYNELFGQMRDLKLATVCEEAQVIKSLLLSLCPRFLTFSSCSVPTSASAGMAA